MVNRAWLIGFGSVLATGAGLLVIATAAAQQSQPAPKVGLMPQTITGSSERGVSAALKDAVDKIPSPKGDQVFRFRLVSVTGEKTAKSSTCNVEIEVTQDGK